MTSLKEPKPHVAVVLASAGRPDVLAEVLADVRQQTYEDLLIVLAVPDKESIPTGDIPTGVVVAPFTRGLTKQRNAGLRASCEATHVFFFDDDAVIREDFIEQAMLFFYRNKDVVALTGRVLLDGVTKETISREQGLNAIAQSVIYKKIGTWTNSRTLYGCNFAVRRVGVPQENFDERLPLYGWLEDHDYARRMMRHGRLAKVDDCVIVHRGVKSGGRTAHARLGYSQVMNPVYLLSTGSFPLWLTAWEIFRPTVKNALRSMALKDSSWRRQRLRGNCLAAIDVVRHRLAPERALEL